MKDTDFTFYSKADYYHELGSQIDDTAAGDRIALATLAFNPARADVMVIMKKLCAAAKRGADVSLSVDSYSFLVGNRKMPGPLWRSTTLPKYMSEPFRIKLAALERLRTSGGRYAIINRPSQTFVNPFSGRSHIKFAVVNNRLYVGGCNLTRMDDIDLMVGWQDKKTADWLYKLSQEVIAANSAVDAMHAKDRIFRLDAQTELLVDAGKRKQSVIFERALEMIDEAQKSVLITCQYFPNGITAEHLIRAHKRGVEVHIIYNHPSKHTLPHSLLHQFVVWRERTRTPKALFTAQLSKKHPFIHAKLIATERGAIVGSHNYVSAGVNFGTAEIALVRHDIGFAEQAIAALRRQL